ncbi:MAG: hypothetical protein O7G87_02335, partial [bacterium]|nr:hypothetical protein [bacterium]
IAEGRRESTESLDRSDRYPEFVQKIRIIGTEARTILQEVIDHTNRNDPNRQTIFQTAHQLLQSLK